VNENVPALERAHGIVTTLITSPWPMGISDLARTLDYSKSTVHGLIHTLVNLGVLEFSKHDARKIQPSRTIFRLWKESLLKGSLAKAAPPLIRAFSEKHDLTTITGFFLSARVLIVDAVLGSGINVAAYPGQMVPVTAAALGKVLAATLPPKQEAALARYLSSKSPLSTSRYSTEIKSARETGVAFDREEYLQGVRALAAAIPSGDPLTPLAAVWIVGLNPNLPEERMHDLVPELRRLADAVGRGMDRAEVKT
jgi:IclR family KDG regulon transcriptional repressor